MSEQVSFTKFEQELKPAYRDRLNKAESTEDVKKFFFYTVQEFFQKIFGDKLELTYDDVWLLPEQNVPYTFSEKINSHPEFISTFKNSDLKHILHKLANSAAHRFKSLEKHPEKNEKQIHH